MAITYHTPIQSNVLLIVKVDGKVSGTINLCAGGYQYVPKNGRGGEVFSTMRDCKQSLEDEGIEEA